MAIIAHRKDRFEHTGYVLHGLSQRWRSSGLEVAVYHEPAAARDADLAILHVDLTVVPSEYQALAARYPRCLNRFTGDISKRAVSRNLVHRGDGFEGPVMVKHNLNSGGQLEALKIENWGASHRVFTDYRVFESASEVPDFVWADPDLVVERFLSEREGDCYCTRLWFFFGHAEIGYRCVAREPIVKSSNTIRRETVRHVPDELRSLREELGFDYGKLDYGVVDGKVVLYDANRTPTYGALTAEQIRERLDCLEAGVTDYVKLPVS